MSSCTHQASVQNQGLVLHPQGIGADSLRCVDPAGLPFAPPLRSGRGNWRPRGLSKSAISRVISTLNGVTLMITLLITDVLSPPGPPSSGGNLLQSPGIARRAPSKSPRRAVKQSSCIGSCGARLDPETKKVEKKCSLSTLQQAGRCWGRVLKVFSDQGP